MRQHEPTAPAELSPNAPEPGASVDGRLDPELVALTAPPQTQRLAALTVMAAAVVAMLALVVSLRSEMSYALSERTPTNLGSVDKLLAADAIADGYVRVSGVPTIARAVRFRRGLGSSYVVFPFSGRHDVFVQVPDTGGEGFVRAEYSGRLTTFGSLGRRYAQLAEVMRRDAGLSVTEDSRILLTGEPPSDYSWTWLVALVCVLFAALDVFLIVRWFRPLKWAQIPASQQR